MSIFQSRVSDQQQAQADEAAEKERFIAALTRVRTAQRELVAAIEDIEGSSDVCSCVAEGGLRAALASLSSPVDLLTDLAS